MKYWRTLIKPGVLLLIGFLFIVIGASNGEALIVFSKASRVCLECIGIG